MEQLEYYLIWSSVSMIIFYLFYLLLLRLETFFVLNRIYLLAALGLSMLFPLLEVSWLALLPKPELITATFAVVRPERLGNQVGSEWSWVAWVYWMGVMLHMIWLFIKIFGIRRQIAQPAKRAAFSFWRTKVVDQKNPNLTVIDAHEGVHVKQLHTLDILFVETINVFFWFNPIVYAYRRSLQTLHEYLADEYAVNFAESKKQYAMLLFLQNLNAGPALANTFNNAPLLESRIKMLQRKKSSHYRLWKYFLCFPLLLAVALLCSFHTSNLHHTAHKKTDRAANFPGGFEAFSKYLVDNTKKISNKNGRVELSFVVETNGKITHPKIEKGLDRAIDEEALRVINASPAWEPALQNGQQVRSAYQVGINF